MENCAMVILPSIASLCGNLLSDTRQNTYVRSIAGSLLFQYSNQDVKHTSIRVAEIAKNVLLNSTDEEITQLAIAITRV